MQINSTTDYAIRLIRYLAQKGVGCRTTSGEISAAIGVGPKYTQRVAMMMRQAGLIASIQGSTGGFMLLSLPEKISLLDVVVAAEEGIQLTPCSECGYRVETEHVCTARPYLDTLQHMVREYLAGVTVADLL